MKLEHSSEDARVVHAQLGREARGEWAVAARCHLDVPMVIESHPVLADGAPFPTTFWLTCPVLGKRASALESAQAMAKMNASLGEDLSLKQRLSDAIDRYRARRDTKAVIDDGGAPPGGGPDRVKCLHAHMAHELVDPPNPIGAIALAATGWPDCTQPCFEVRG